eukprot:SAG11_NODE_16378_length_549_cov_0.811111_1_plen_20_part_10
MVLVDVVCTGGSCSSLEMVV